VDSLLRKKLNCSRTEAFYSPVKAKCIDDTFAVREACI
jgi:hypothetical protein